MTVVAGLFLLAFFHSAAAVPQGAKRRLIEDTGIPDVGLDDGAVPNAEVDSKPRGPSHEAAFEVGERRVVGLPLGVQVLVGTNSAALAVAHACSVKF
jgi:hypothetical protein